MEACLQREVEKNLSCGFTENAVFLCERLFAEKPDEENAFLLARCYVQNRQEYRAYHVLKDGGPLKVLGPKSRLLLAQCCMKLGKPLEAEEVLLKKYRRPQEDPLGAVEYFLLGKIQRLRSRGEIAKKYFAKALELDPFLWLAFEELCKLGANTDAVNHLQNMTSIAEIENEMQSLHINTPVPRMATPTPRPHTASPLVNAPNQMAQGTDLSFQGFIDEQRHIDGSPRTPTTMTSPAPRGFPWNHGGVNMHDEMQEDQVTPPQVTPQKKQSSRQRRKHNSDMPIRKSARLAKLQLEEESKKEKMSSARKMEATTPPPSANRHLRTMSQQRAHHSARQQESTGSAQRNQSGEGRTNETGTTDVGAKKAMELLTFLGEGYRLLSMFHCKEAIQVFSRLATNQYCTGWVLCQVAKAHAESVDYHSAERCFENARVVDPQRLEDMDVYSTVLWQLGEDAKLSHLASDALSLERLAPQTWCIVGNLHSRQREHETAIRAFQRAMQLDADRPYSYTLCGHEYFAVEDIGNAQQCFQKAIDKDGRHYNAWYGCGLVYFRQEKYISAEAQFRQAISINNSSSVLKCQLGMTLAKSMKHDAALVQLQRAINADRKNIISWLEKAKVLEIMGKNDDALEVLQGALVIEHRDPCLHYHIGNVYKKLGNTNEAIKHYFQALDLNPSAKDQISIRTAIEKINVEGDSQDTEL